MINLEQTEGKSMTTIKFTRPDGEARLTTPGLPVDFSFSWRPSSADAYQPDGGFVLVECRHGRYAHFPRGIGLDRELAKFVDPVPVIAEAEKLRNEKRKLGANEWRDPVTGDVMTFSRPTLVGFDRKSTGWKQVFASEWHLGPVGEHTEKQGWYIAALAWHRAAYLPLLSPDEAYPPGELPRKMAEDEVRGPDGSALKMRMGTDSLKRPLALIGENMRWHPARPWELPTPCPFDDPQLARLQAFWDANQPKEAELNLRWTGGDRWVLFSVDGEDKGFTGSWSHHHPETLRKLSPAQHATVEAFFAAGPPAELAEDVVKFSSGQRYRMSVVDGRLRLSGLDCDYQCSCDRPEMERAAQRFPNPLGWPRALAYFDRHVAKPEPARVTDVEFIDGAACFVFAGSEWQFYGQWDDATHPKLHPLDIALIERCWAEGRLGEREVLADDGTVVTVQTNGYGGFEGTFRGGHIRSIDLDPGESDNDGWWNWPSCKPGGLTIHDPTQRARVRAIVAGMQKEKADGSKNQLHTVAHGSDDSGDGESPGRGTKSERGDGSASNSNTGGDSVSPVAGGSGATDRSAPGLSGGVTPSGEVKAPFDKSDVPPHAFPFVDGRGNSAMVWFDWLCKSYGDGGVYSRPVSGADDLPALYQAAAVALPDAKLRNLHAALSDHIRRGDDSGPVIDMPDDQCPVCGERGAMYCFAKGKACEQAVYVDRSVVDLTELREAIEQWNAGDIGARQVAQVAERLVGKS